MKIWRILAAAAVALVAIFLLGRQEATIAESAVSTPRPAIVERELASAAQILNIEQKPAPPDLVDYLTLEQLTETIRADAFCDKNNEPFLDTAKLRPGEVMGIELYKALVAANSETANTCILANVDRNKVLELEKLENRSVACEFLLALYYTNQIPTNPLEGERDFGPEDFANGLQILGKLQKQDPTNGIYPFFKIGALVSLGRADEIKQSVGEVLRAEKFQSPEVELTMELRKLGHLNATSMLLQEIIAANFPFPNYSISASAFGDWIKAYPSPEAGAWVKRWGARIDMLDRERVRDVAQDLLEIMVLTGIARKYWNAHLDPDTLPYNLSLDGLRLLIPQLQPLSHEQNDHLPRKKYCEKLLGNLRRIHKSFISLYDQSLK